MELAIAMILQESSPHQHIRDMRVRCNMRRVSLARSDSAEMAHAATQRAGRNSGGRAVTDGVEDVLGIGRSRGDVVNDVGVVVVEDVFGAAGSNEVGVAGTAGCDYLEAEERGELDGVEADTCCSLFVSRLFEATGTVAFWGL